MLWAETALNRLSENELLSFLLPIETRHWVAEKNRSECTST